MKKPTFRVYAMMEPTVDLVKAKIHIRRKFQAFRVSILEGDEISSLTFYIPLWSLHGAWHYLQKKRGTKNIRLGV